MKIFSSYIKWSRINVKVNKGGDWFKMINNLISLAISEYAIALYEAVTIIVLFFIIMKKNKKVKLLKQEMAIDLQRAKDNELDNMLRNKRKGDQ